ncbi:MAG: TlpA family protein disulfide reductase, partial [Chitinophagaceae bacterium]
SWCGPCRVANRVGLPQLAALLRQAKSTLISVSVDNDQVKWLNALREDVPSWPQFRDQAAGYSLKEYFKVTSYPTYMVFDSKGRHVYTSHVDADLHRYLVKVGGLQGTNIK